MHKWTVKSIVLTYIAASCVAAAVNRCHEPVSVGDLVWVKTSAHCWYPALVCVCSTVLLWCVNWWMF